MGQMSKRDVKNIEVTYILGSDVKNIEITADSVTTERSTTDFHVNGKTVFSVNNNLFICFRTLPKTRETK